MIPLPERLKPKYSNMCHSSMPCPVCIIINNAHPPLPREFIYSKMNQVSI
jgi:hypothetical protein